MATVRTIVRRRMKELDMTPYRLVQLVKGRMSSATVYDFVNKGRAISTAKLEPILAALGLEVRPKD